MKAVAGAFNQEKALVGAFSVIVKLHRLIVYSTSLECMTLRHCLKRNSCLYTDNDRVVVVVSVACYDSKHILMSGTMQHEQIICRDTSLLFKLMPH